VAVADFDGDGRPDVVAAQSASTSNSVTVLLNNGDGTFRQGGSASAGPDPVAIVAGDFNGDGKMDVAVANQLNNEVTVLLGNGDGSFGAPVSYAVGANPHGLAAVDLNGDGRLDLVATDAGSDTVTVLLNNGDGTFAPGAQTVVGNHPEAIATGDFNGDGKPDVAVTTLGGNASFLDILTGNGAGGFSSVVPIATGANPEAITTGDFNGDGKPDLAYADSVTGIFTMLGNGDGTFQAAQFVLADSNAQTVATADFNGDGTADLAERSGLTYEVELGRGDGTFYPASTYAAATGTKFGAVADLNGDGAPDIVGATSFPSPGGVAVVLNAADDLANVAGAVGFRVTGAGTAVAGSPTSVTVTAVDASGNPVAGFRGTVYLGSTDPKAILPAAGYAFTAADAGSHTFTNAETERTAGVVSITASAPLMAAGSAPLTVVPGAAAQFVTSSAGGVAGQPITVTVAAFDAFGNPATNTTDTVGLRSSDGQSFPAAFTFTPADAGVHQFQEVITRAATTTVTVTDAAHPAATTAPTPFQVAPAAVSRLIVTSRVFDAIDAFIAGNQEFFVVTGVDAFGNETINDSSTAVSLSATNIPESLVGTLTDGQFAFDAVWTKAGLQTVTAAAVSDPTVTGSLGVVIAPAAAATIQISGATTTVAGAPYAVTVSIFDPYGNLATNYLGGIQLSSADARAALPPAYTYTAADAGVHTFVFPMGTAGPQFVAAKIPQDSLIRTAVIGVTVTPGAAAGLVVSGFPATTAGVAQAFTVTVVDAFGNPTTGYTGTVRFSSSDVQAGLPSSYTFTAADAGVHTFTATLKTAGTQSITVADAANPADAATEAGIAVTPGAATHFVIAAPATITAGKAFTVIVTALDAFGNVAPSYRGKVQFKDSAGSGGLPSSYTFTAADAGVHVFTLTLSTQGAQVLTLADLTTPSILGSLGLTVAPAQKGGGKTG
jgi:hypothetical protein